MYIAPSGNKRLKHVIEEDMFNHHVNVICAKPILNITKSTPHVNHLYQNLCCPSDIVHSKDHSVVRSTFKALIKNNKGVVDTSQPKTFELIDKLNLNRNPNDYDNVEHNRNLISLEQRMNHVKDISVTASYYISNGRRMHMILLLIQAYSLDQHIILIRKI